jgi:beta-galactosidase GanA
MENRWQDLYKHLQSKGYDVYSPFQKEGDCITPYIVVKNSGSSQHRSFSTDVDLYTIMCYVPRDEYSKLETFVVNVKKAMKDIYPLFIPTGSQTPSFYDDTYKAHMISIDYKNYKKMP